MLCLKKKKTQKKHLGMLNEEKKKLNVSLLAYDDACKTFQPISKPIY